MQSKTWLKKMLHEVNKLLYYDSILKNEYHITRFSAHVQV